jgi:DNA-binding IclR family transcriptional regulator
MPKLTKRATQVLDYLQAKGRATLREAFLDLDINSGSFTRRVTEIKDAGYGVTVDSHRHPLTNRLYRSYTYDPSVKPSLVRRLG